MAQNQATHTLVETTNNPNGNQQQHIVTQHDNSDGSTSLQIAQMQNIPATHQLTLSNLNQVSLFMDKYLAQVPFLMNGISSFLIQNISRAKITLS